MGRKIKKVIMIAAFGMVTGGQIADLLPEGNVMQVEAGSRKQIIKVKNKGYDCALSAIEMVQLIKEVEA